MIDNNIEGRLEFTARSRKVLLIDDSPVCRLVTKAYLKEAGHFLFVEASSAGQAIEKLKGEIFDIVICDYFMENDTGLDVVHYLREEKQEIPFFFFTSEPGHLNGSNRDGYRVFDKADIMPLIKAVMALVLS